MSPDSESRTVVEEHDAVDLGQASDVIEGRAQVLRHHEVGEAGLPSLTHLGQEELEGSFFSKARGVLRSYGSLRQTPYGLTPALILGAITFFGYFEAQAYAFSRPAIVEELELDVLSLIDVSLIVSAISIIASVAFGWWLDRHIRAPWVGIGAMSGAVAGMFSSRSTSLFALGFPRIAGETFEQAGAVPRFSLLADYYPPETRGKVFALLGTLRRMGLLMAIFVAGAGIEWFGWRVTIFVLAVPLFLIGVIAVFKLREPVRGYMERKALGADEEVARTEDEPQSFGEAWRTTFSVRTLRRLFIADAIGAGAEGVVSLYLIFFLAEEYHLSGIELSMFSIPAIIAALVGGIYGGQLIDRLVGRNPGRVLTVYGAFLSVSAFGVLGYAIQPPLYVLMAFSAFTGFGGALIGPATSAVYSQVLPPNIRTQGLQITGLAVLPGLLILGNVARTIFGNYGYQEVFLFCLPLILLGGLIAVSAGSFFDLDARSAAAAALASDEWRKAQSEGNGKLLVCRDVDVEYNGVQVLFGVDFDVEEGEVIALLGTNGAGKSTLLRAISGITQATGGAIVFDGRDVTHMPPHEVAARGVIQMPGGRGIFPELSVRENLLLALWMVDDPEDAKARLSEVFEVFPQLLERSSTEARALSGGEQQQLSLAQAFLGRPRLLLIDELSLGLSPAVVAHLLDIVREIHRRGVSIVVVEQSVNVALAIADKAVFMEKGEVRFFGPTAELLSRPDILRAVYVKGAGALGSAGSRGTRLTEQEQRSRALATARTVLEVEGLTKTFGGVRAVDDVSFNLREGEVLGLIGPNGAGKTTVFELISGFQTLDSGRVFYQGMDVTNLTPEERSKRGLVRRFQDARLFGSLTVFETLLVALDKRLTARSTLLNAASAPQVRRAERRLRVEAERLIELFELGAFRDKFVKELSTGLRRIVDMACVLAAEPTVLLLDEPSSGIAQAEAESLGPLLRRAQYETGCSILIIEHDMPLISKVSDELLALVQGQVLLRGTPDAVLEDERVIEAYLGTDQTTIQRTRSE